MNRDLVGRTFGPFLLAYGVRDVALHALSVGAGPDDLPLVYERHGPEVLPTFAALPAFRAAMRLFPVLGLDGAAMVQGEQRLALARPVPPCGTGSTTVTVRGIDDKGSGAVLRLETRTQVDGAPLAENLLTFFVIGHGGFGGTRGPAVEHVAPPERPADRRVPFSVPPASGLLYRLGLLPNARMEQMARDGAGDPHVDPAAARAAGFERPLVYALATLGHLALAVLRADLDAPVTAMRAVRGRFVAPVHAGDDLVAELWREGSRIIGRLVGADGRVALDDGAIDLAPSSRE